MKILAGLKTITFSAVLASAFLSVNTYAEADYSSFKTKRDSTHEVTVINHGMASFEERLRLVESAKESIEIEYFIYNADLSGKIFTQALIKKAREGVKIRVLLDYFMIKDQINTFMIHELKNEGIDVRYYNPAPSIRFIKVQYRNHRKILVVDNSVAMTGGRNIGNEYFDLSPEFNFLDRDIVIRGELVADIKNSFDVVWNSDEVKEKKRPREPRRNDGKYSSHHDNFSDFEYRHDLARFKKRIDTAREFLLEEANGEKISEIRDNGTNALKNEYSGKCESMEFLSEYPIANSDVKKQRVIKHDIFNKIRSANETVLVDSPYFILDDEASDSFKMALDKGTNVELLTNGLNSTDAIYVYAVFETIVKDWIKLGLKPYMFLGHKPTQYATLDADIKEETRFGVHAKTLVFDNKDVTIGTFNFDPRSYNFNTEMVVTCNNNPELAAVVSGDIHHRMESAVLLDSEEKVKETEFYKVDTGKKIIYWLLKIPSNLLDHLL